MNDIQNNFLLPALIFLPILTGFLCWLIEKVDERFPRWIAFIGMFATFLITVGLWQKGGFIGSASQVLAPTDKPVWLAEFSLPWIEQLGIHFHLALDGLSLLMVSLTAFLGMMAVACSWGEITRRVGFFHLNLLWSLGGVIGVFLAIDLFLFFFFGDIITAVKPKNTQRPSFLFIPKHQA